MILDMFSPSAIARRKQVREEQALVSKALQQQAAQMRRSIEEVTAESQSLNGADTEMMAYLRGMRFEASRTSKARQH